MNTKEKSAKLQIMGYRNAENGKLFEQWISSACDMYREQGIAHIEKTPEPMRIIKALDRKTGKYVACFEKSAQPDYKGILCDGTGIMFEAKHTSTGKINQSVVSTKQWENFDLYERMGAKCYVMVSLDFIDFYRVPWDVFKNMKTLYGRKYMNRENLEPFRIKERHCFLLFLDGIELKEETEPEKQEKTEEKKRM